MQLPPILEDKFKELLGRYPVKRSALVPMMMYAQDHYGFLGDELLEEIARRIGLNMIQVTETLAYYSMLRRKPAGRFHIQVCTNISCMLRGGAELFQHVQSAWKSATNRFRRRELSRSKRWNASAPARARPQCR